MKLRFIIRGCYIAPGLNFAALRRKWWRLHLNAIISNVVKRLMLYTVYMSGIMEIYFLLEFLKLYVCVYIQETRDAFIKDRRIINVPYPFTFILHQNYIHHIILTNHEEFKKKYHELFKTEIYTKSDIFQILNFEILCVRGKIALKLLKCASCLIDLCLIQNSNAWFFII